MTDRTEAAGAACPYAGDGVVYTATMHPAGKELTGRFYRSLADGPFWTMEGAAGGAGDWIALNPAYIISVRAAELSDEESRTTSPEPES